MERDVLERIFEGSIEPRDLKLSALEIITENFSEERIIGTGGFGTVYKGALRNGEIALKRIKNNYTIDENVFRREVNSLLKVNHKNIVRFLGFCSHTEHKVFEKEGSRDYIYAENRERILCFEYINNGSLDKYITDELRGLPWDTRVLIIKGICEGLQYLHLKKQIIHMDLKPANILIDNNMVAKITDFGLSRMEENAQTKSTTRVSSPGYTAPEYIEKGEMSVKYDVYSLGIIIIELVTGHRSIPDNNDVLRKWRHRWHKSGNEIPFRYQQITKLIEIGLLCQEKDPYRRPFISDIIRVINELESTDRQISSADKSTVEQISPYLENDMLGIEPLELHFPFKLNKRISCSLELTNETNAFIAFSIQTTSPLSYSINPNKEIVAPRTKYSVNITLQPLDKAPHDKHIGDFIVRSTKVNESLISDDITEDIFNRKKGKFVDDVNLTISYKAEVTQMVMSLGSLIISDTRHLNGLQESNVPPTEAESKIGASTLDEVIQFDPPELCFPLVPDKKVSSSIKIINITECYVSFTLSFPNYNSAYYFQEDSLSILPPGSTRWLRVTREEKEDVVKDMQFNDEVFVWYAIVAEDIKASDLVWEDYNEWKNLPIVLTKTPSVDLIQFDPPELCLPLLPNQRVLSSTKIVNITDQFIGFEICTKKSNSASYYANPSEGILPPLSTQVLLVTRIAEEKELEDTQYRDKFLVWNNIVTEDTKGNYVIDNMSDRKTTELPIVLTKIVLTKTNLPTSEELIQFDSPELHFPYLPNKRVMSSVKVVNLTDYNVGFNVYGRPTNTAWYHTEPPRGILPPRSTKKLTVTREEKEDALEDNRFKDKYFVSNSIVAEGVKDNELSDYIADQESKDLPIVLDKVSSSISGELIQLDPAELCIPLFPNKKMLFTVNVVNTTDFYVAFNAYCIKRDAPLCKESREEGILPPRSSKKHTISWVTKETELDCMEPPEDYFVWNRVVTEGVEIGDIIGYMDEKESKNLPLVINKESPCTLNELIQFDQPELSLPFVPNKPLVFSVNIVNITDYYVGFYTYVPNRNVGRYEAEPVGGVMPPRSTQRLVVKRLPKKSEQEYMQCEDKLLLWSSLVSEDAEASDFVDHTNSEGVSELPIVCKKTSLSTSDELIQLDPPQITFPFLPNKRVSMLRFFKIVNVTEHNIGFSTTFHVDNSAWYRIEPHAGILPPQSTLTIKVRRTLKEMETEDMLCKDKIFLWNGIVTEGIHDSDVCEYSADEDKELPIVLVKPGERSSS